MDEPPDFLQEAPRLWPHLRVYLDAFWDLVGDRAGMGDGRILWTAAYSWACCHGWDGEAFRELWYYLRELDTVFLAHRDKK
jgi:hypothetical protein